MDFIDEIAYGPSETRSVDIGGAMAVFGKAGITRIT
jgi:hypothetical protein